MNVLALYNLKGGVGKTASAVNLAYIAALDGLRVLIWDLDPQGAASFYFRVRPELDGGRKALVEKRRRSELYLQIRGTDTERLDLIPADFSLRKLDIALDGQKKPRRWLERLLEPLAEDYDLVVLDTPPSLSRLSEAVFRVADALLVPTIPTPLSLRTLEQLESHLNSRKLTVPAWPFFSMVDRRKRLHREILTTSISGPKRLEATIPYASDVERMGIERCPVVELAPSGAAARAYLSLWSEIKQRLAGSAA